MNMMNERKLLELKEKINADKARLQELNGQEKNIFEQLKEEFDCNSLKLAEKLQNDLQVELEQIKALIKEKEETLEQF